FMHKILEKYAKNELSIFEMPMYYEEHYAENITYPAPPNNYVDIGQSYYDKGLDFLENIDLDLENYEILGVEKEVHFTIGKYKMVGFIDLLLREKEAGKIIILDHKSASIKFLKNGEISKSCKEHFRSFVRQLCLYAKPTIEEYGRVDELWWNLFKERKWIKIQFTESDYNEAIKWVEDTIKAIENDVLWCPNPDDYFCRNLCDMRNKACEYKP
ncbi:MAG: PD-(D/E)XK nuclease family protein, partial [Ruminococcus sp.]|nr:PD-(D/E)XK nuclease family protein [Ruminococcus sp.]